MIGRKVALVAVLVVFGTLGVGSVMGEPVPVIAQTASSGLCDTAGVEQFTDVADTDYAAAYVLCMRALGLSAGFGDGNYGPDRDLTRAQMATFLVRLWRLLGNQCPTAVTSPFTDVVAGATHAEDIDCIYGLGITLGTTDTTYGPQDPLEAWHVTLFLYRVYKKTGATVCDGLTGSSLERATECLLQLHVIPNSVEATATAPVTRAQMAVYVIGLWHNFTSEGGVLPPSPPVKPQAGSQSRWSAISVGRYHSCGVNLDGNVECWGFNGNGQTEAPSGEYVGVSAGGVHSCAVRIDGSVVCWGGDDDERAEAPAGKFSAVTAGGFHSCALKTDGTTICWVWNDAEQVGEGVDMFSSIAAGEFYACAVKSTGDVLCGGSVEVPDGKFVTLDTYRHSCGIRPDGTAVCWGDNRYGQLNVPAGRYMDISVGSVHSCGIHMDGTAVCWGSNEQGQSNVPLGRYKDIDVGPSHSCAIRADDSAVC